MRNQTKNFHLLDTPNIEKFFYFQPRNRDWRPLNGVETEKEEWVRSFLLDHLESITGTPWKLVGANVLHTETEFHVSEEGKLEIAGVLKKLKDVYGFFKEQDFGFKIDNGHPLKFVDGKCMWYGIIAISSIPIINRGQIVGNKFGL